MREPDRVRLARAQDLVIRVAGVQLAPQFDHPVAVRVAARGLYVGSRSLGFAEDDTAAADPPRRTWPSGRRAPRFSSRSGPPCPIRSLEIRLRNSPESDDLLVVHEFRLGAAEEGGPAGVAVPVLQDPVVAGVADSVRARGAPLPEIEEFPGGLEPIQLGGRLDLVPGAGVIPRRPANKQIFPDVPYLSPLRPQYGCGSRRSCGGRPWAWRAYCRGTTSSSPPAKRWA